jgi:DNA-directed RNA polymerase specialized sigma24 family protein
MEYGTDPTIASLINAVEAGDGSAATALFAALYSELHRLARRELARQGFPVSLSATTLLHEAYIDMAEREGSSFPDHARFMGYAARVMRGLIRTRSRSIREGRPQETHIGPRTLFPQWSRGDA